MTKIAKRVNILRKKALLALVMMTILLLAACGGQGELKGALNYEVEDFTFTNQDGEQLGLQDLQGKVWLADFIFTNCETICLPMTSNMKKLQTMAAEEDIENIEFISFSVDPTVDSPEILKAYAEQHEADFTNWNFLTGYEQKFIEQFGLKSFKTLIQKPASDDQVIHQSYFYLVNQEGKIQKYYSGASDTPFEEIIDDIKKLQ